MPIEMHCQNCGELLYEGENDEPIPPELHGAFGVERTTAAARVMP